jgi:hypothetical protein
MSYSAPRLSYKDFGIYLLYSGSRTRSVLIRYTVYRIIVYSRTKISE